jgi:hypothetical protein
VIIVSPGASTCVFGTCLLPTSRGATPMTRYYSSSGSHTAGVVVGGRVALWCWSRRHHTISLWFYTRRRRMLRRMVVVVNIIRKLLRLGVVSPARRTDQLSRACFVMISHRTLAAPNVPTRRFNPRTPNKHMTCNYALLIGSTTTCLFPHKPSYA